MLERPDHIILYQKKICNKYNSSMHNAMLQVYLKNSQIEEALELKLNGEEHQPLSPVGYLAFMNYYLTDDHLDPAKGLEMMEECQRVNPKRKMLDNMLNLKFVAYNKLLLMSEDEAKRDEYFEIVKQQPMARLEHGMAEYDLATAKNVFDAYLYYYNYDTNSTEIMEYFEKVSEHIGYWQIDGRTGKKVLDLHRYNYDQIEFVLHYLLTVKKKELRDMMGYDWRILTGKRLSTNPRGRGREGIQSFVIKHLEENYDITAKIDKWNAGIVKLNQTDTARHFCTDSSGHCPRSHARLMQQFHTTMLTCL